MVLTRTQAREEAHHLGHVRLYRDELDQIIRAVAEIGEPAIEGPGFTATTEQDLADPAVPGRLDWLTITARDGEHQLRVTLSRTSAVVELTEPNTLLHGVLNRVLALCQHSRRREKPNVATGMLHPDVARRARRAQKISVWFVCACLVMATFIVAVPYFTLDAAERPSWVLVVAYSCVGMVALWLAWQFRRRSSAVLLNAYRADQPTFWRRKRDDLMINAVVLVLGAVLGGVVTKIMG